MIQELYEEIARLTVENERIKKTSKQRFEKNKKLDENKVYVEGELFKIKCINEFLVDNGFELKTHRGLPMVSYSVFNAIRSLQEKGKIIKKPQVDGIYSVKINGDWSVKRIEHRICWMFIGENGDQRGIHFFDVDEFVLLEANK